MLPVLLPLTVIEIGSGLVLGSFEATLLRYPSLLVLVPVTIGTAGNLGSILAARLSTPPTSRTALASTPTTSSSPS